MSKGNPFKSYGTMVAKSPAGAGEYQFPRSAISDGIFYIESTLRCYCRLTKIQNTLLTTDENITTSSASFLNTLLVICALINYHENAKISNLRLQQNNISSTISRVAVKVSTFLEDIPRLWFNQQENQHTAETYDTRKQHFRGLSREEKEANLATQHVEIGVLSYMEVVLTGVLLHTSS
uniref:Uncharacterized protein n=1 Tax=Glossina pallidipes TaxID=7398 RepID=A0A1A9ZUW2_GLOPL